MLKAGFSRVDVTPPLGASLEGYFTKRYAKGILDPIELNAIAFSNGDATALIITADFLAMRKEYVDEIRREISVRVKISENNIMVCALHQHTSIALRDTNGNNIMTDRVYLDGLYRKFCDVAEMAINDMSDAKIFIGMRETDEKISFIRRYLMKDGIYATNPFGRSADVVRPYRDADNNVRLCRFKREGKKDVALVNFSTHPDVIGGELLSADWPGAVRRFVEADISNTSCIFLTGAQGDSNHWDFTKEELCGGYEHSLRMGRVIADTVSKLWDNVEEQCADKISADVDIVFNRTRTDGIEKFEEAKRFLDENKEANGSAELGNCSRIVRLRNAPIFQQIPISVINLGNVGFVGFGGEPFTQYGDDIREKCPDRFLICACNANGAEGYLPNSEAFAEGGYEASSSMFSPEIEDQCIEMAKKLLNK